MISKALLSLVLTGAAIVTSTPPATAAPFRSSAERSVFVPIRPLVSPAAKRGPVLSFDLTRSAGAAACLADAHGEVRITARGGSQELEVFVSGLPANTTFTVFILQLPHAPFGLSWYQGDLETNRRGEGHASFVGIFNDETFIVAPGAGAAPGVHPADALVNPATGPIHTFHIGMWFDSTADAVAAGCAANQTPFNGDHTAGIQVLNTTNFPDADGPIGQFGR